MSPVGDSYYEDEKFVHQRVAVGEHRRVIGGMWEQIGQLQRDFLIAEGLMAEHSVLDVGCGSLRGGVYLIPYLEPAKYWGVDLNQSLLEAGWEREIVPAGLQDRQPRSQLVCLQDFEFNRLGQTFDFAIAISVFTHMNLNKIRRCLARLAPALTQGGRLYATFFEVPDSQDREESCVQKWGGVKTSSVSDPFHYRLSDFEFAVHGSGLSVTYYGDWGHPRNQKMVLFSKQQE